MMGGIDLDFPHAISIKSIEADGVGVIDSLQSKKVNYVGHGRKKLTPQRHRGR